MSRTRPLIGLSTQRNNQAEIEKNYIAHNYMILKSKPLDHKKGDAVAASYILYEQTVIATITHIFKY